MFEERSLEMVNVTMVTKFPTYPGYRWQANKLFLLASHVGCKLVFSAQQEVVLLPVDDW